MIARLTLIANLGLVCAALVGCDRSASSPPLAAPAATQSAPASSAVSDLAGTSWQLVKFSGSDGATLQPDERSKYTIAFQADGSVAALVDCNRGRGTWKSTGPGLVQLGPLATTRMMCPPGSMDSRVVGDWEAVRSYAIKDGHLFLSLADGGIYEYEPAVPVPE